jgi:hypothetical protein
VYRDQTYKHCKHPNIWTAWPLPAERRRLTHSQITSADLVMAINEWDANVLTVLSCLRPGRSRNGPSTRVTSLHPWPHMLGISR